MKILIYSDVHWNTCSSLIRGRGNTFSVRLEHLIDSMNWLNQVAIKRNCDCLICAGDFMDKAQLTDEELTALRQIRWSDLPCYFLCGNHESSVSDLRFSSIKALENSDHIIINKLSSLRTADCDLLFIPYIIESDRKPLIEYIKEAKLNETNKPLIIFSHNDLAGINYAGFESKLGFSVDEIDTNCNLYLNGHLHNSEWISKKILNVGSFSAHNFTNDSKNYQYGIWILDTESRQLEFIENPYGFNFYKLDILTEADLSQFDSLKSNTVISVRCTESLVAKVYEKLMNPNIIEHRLTTIRQASEDSAEVSIATLQTDHLSKFIEFCKTNINNSPILETELAEICK